MVRLFTFTLPPVGWMVGLAGFEPTTSSSRTKRTTKLCYSPKNGLPRFSGQIGRIITAQRARKWEVAISERFPPGERGAAQGRSLGCIVFCRIESLAAAGLQS